MQTMRIHIYNTLPPGIASIKSPLWWEWMKGGEQRNIWMVFNRRASVGFQERRGWLKFYAVLISELPRARRRICRKFIARFYARSRANPRNWRYGMSLSRGRWPFNFFILRRGMYTTYMYIICCICDCIKIRNTSKSGWVKVSSLSRWNYRL